MPSRNLNSLWGYGFFKKGFKSNRFQVVVWSQNYRFSYFSFLKGFPAKKMASLALTAFFTSDFPRTKKTLLEFLMKSEKKLEDFPYKFHPG